MGGNLGCATHRLGTLGEDLISLSIRFFVHKTEMVLPGPGVRCLHGPVTVGLRGLGRSVLGGQLGLKFEAEQRLWPRPSPACRGPVTGGNRESCGPPPPEPRELSGGQAWPRLPPALCLKTRSCCGKSLPRPVTPQAPVILRAVPGSGIWGRLGCCEHSPWGAATLGPVAVLDPARRRRAAWAGSSRVALEGPGAPECLK